MHVVDVLLAADEDAVACLEVALVGVEQAEVLLRDFFVDLGALDHFVEHFEELEAREERGVVFEALRDDGCNALVDVFHLALEGAEVVAELLASDFVVDVHDVVVFAVEFFALVFEHVVREVFQSLVEHVMNVLDVLCELVSLCSANGDFFEDVVVHGSLNDVFEVCAALDEAVELFEERGVDDVPAAVGAVLVVLVDEFEAPAGLADLFEAAERSEEVGLGDLADEVGAVELLAALRDDLVADLPDEDDEVGVRLVVVARVLDEHDEVHDGHEDLFDFGDRVREALQLLEVLLEGREEALVVLGLVLGLRHLLLEFVKGADVVRGLAGEESFDFDEFFRDELGLDVVEVVLALVPELDFLERACFLVGLEYAFGVLLEDLLD